LTDKPSRVPRCARRKLFAFKQHNIGATAQRQVIGNTATDNAAADYYDPSIFRDIDHLIPFDSN
jgi:hypothetical protein